MCVYCRMSCSLFGIKKPFGAKMHFRSNLVYDELTQVQPMMIQTLLTTSDFFICWEFLIVVHFWFIFNVGHFNFILLCIYVASGTAQLKVVKLCLFCTFYVPTGIKTKTELRKRIAYKCGNSIFRVSIFNLQYLAYLNAKIK